MAAAVKDAVRSTDVAFRYGGEELAVLLHSVPQAASGAVAEKIRAAVRAPARSSPAPSKAARPRCPSGSSTFPEDGHGVKALVDAADAALYAAKAQGRDRVVLAGAPGVGAGRGGRHTA